ncbi:MAG TPA: hypothetical protein VFM14_05945 [Gemmatimonadales bacterium]|nr:hypothetical protein [Gemmatimonadales bacterium]
MMNDVLTPGTILLALLAALAARVLFRSRRPADPPELNPSGDEPSPGGDAGQMPCRDQGRCSWKLHVVGVAQRRCTVLLFGRSVHLKRGDLLLALRPTEIAQPVASADLSPAQSSGGR